MSLDRRAFVVGLGVAATYAPQLAKAALADDGVSLISISHPCEALTAISAPSNEASIVYWMSNSDFFYWRDGGDLNRLETIEIDSDNFKYTGLKLK